MFSNLIWKDNQRQLANVSQPQPDRYSKVNQYNVQVSSQVTAIMVEHHLIVTAFLPHQAFRRGNAP
jgi:hypothetical protein